MSSTRGATTSASCRKERFTPRGVGTDRPAFGIAIPVVDEGVTDGVKDDQPARGACLLGCGRPRRMNVTIGSARLSNAVSRMSPRLRRICGVSCRALAKSVLLLTCCIREQIDELACVVALLEISPLENSSPVHLA